MQRNAAQPPHASPPLALVSGGFFIPCGTVPTPSADRQSELAYWGARRIRVDTQSEAAIMQQIPYIASFKAMLPRSPLMVSCVASAVIHAAAFSLTVDYPLFQPSMNPYKAPIYLEERASPLEVTPKRTVQEGKNIKNTQKNPRESKRPSGAVARKETSSRGQRRGRPRGDAHISGGEEMVLLDTREPRYAPYLTRIRHRIEEFWNYPECAKEFGIEGDATLRFSILGDGTVSSLLLITSSGFETLDEESLRAVRIADPYPPLPDHLGLTKLSIIATFQYRIRPSFLPET